MPRGPARRLMPALRTLAVLALALPLTGCVAPPAGEPAPAAAPYADLAASPIRGLAPEAIAELREGAGAGLALPAELNGYPGPKHMLELAEALGLSTEQRAATQDLRDATNAEARRVGERVLRAYEALDNAFRHGTVGDATLDGLLAEVGAAEAELRGVHLKAHVRALDVLDQEQLRRYAELRGYAEAHAGAGHGH